VINVAVRGADILILVEGATPDTFIVVGGQQSATISESVETVETTNKLTNGFKEFEYGFGEWKISADGIYVSDDAGFQKLKDAMRAKTKVKVRIKEEGVDVEEGLALITSRDLEGKYDDSATYSVELQGTGALTPVSA
jgi:TP901-1 family phage major tail protein